MPQNHQTDGRTKPDSLLKHIPIKTDRWEVIIPGFVEVDLVSHSGNTADGEFVYSLNLTDIHTGWVETCAVMTPVLSVGSILAKRR